MSYTMAMDGAVLRIRLYDTLTDVDLRDLADDVLGLEANQVPTPARVTDMSGLRRISVGFREMLAFVERRRASPPKQSIRSALVVESEVQYGIARMFQTLNNHPLVSVEIFRDASKALDWVEDRSRRPSGAAVADARPPIPTSLRDENDDAVGG